MQKVADIADISVLFLDMVGGGMVEIWYLFCWNDDWNISCKTLFLKMAIYTPKVHSSVPSLDAKRSQNYNELCIWAKMPLFWAVWAVWAICKEKRVHLVL